MDMFGDMFRTHTDPNMLNVIRKLFFPAEHSLGFVFKLLPPTTHPKWVVRMMLHDYLHKNINNNLIPKSISQRRHHFVVACGTPPPATPHPPLNPSRALSLSVNHTLCEPTDAFQLIKIILNLNIVTKYSYSYSWIFIIKDMKIEQ